MLMNSVTTKFTWSRRIGPSGMSRKLIPGTLTAGRLNEHHILRATRWHGGENVIKETPWGLTECHAMSGGNVLLYEATQECGLARARRANHIGVGCGPPPAKQPAPSGCRKWPFQDTVRLADARQVDVKDTRRAQVGQRFCRRQQRWQPEVQWKTVRKVQPSRCHRAIHPHGGAAKDFGAHQLKKSDPATPDSAARLHSMRTRGLHAARFPAMHRSPPDGAPRRPSPRCRAFRQVTCCRSSLLKSRFAAHRQSSTVDGVDSDQLRHGIEHSLAFANPRIGQHDLNFLLASHRAKAHALGVHNERLCHRTDPGLPCQGFAQSAPRPCSRNDTRAATRRARC